MRIKLILKEPTLEEKIEWLTKEKERRIKAAQRGEHPYYCAVDWCSCGGRRIGGCDCECHDVLED